MPCPTPATDLDRHREESIEAQRAASKAASEARSAGARLAELERRLASARAAYDSLSIDASGEPARKPEP